jgi:NAD(P)-dependent dehydrogenase (short-subunit alcohol dehydrogenase family)
MAVPFRLTTDGFETHWQTNYLAPFYLVKLLLPLLKSTAAASTSESRVRVVNVSSEAALLTAPKAFDLEHPNLKYLTGAMPGW